MLTTITPNDIIIEYDKEYDIVTVYIKGEKLPSYCHAINEWVQLHISINTEEYTGITVWDFSKVFKSKELMDLDLPFESPWDYVAKEIKSI